MAIIQSRQHLVENGEFKTVHLETSAELVLETTALKVMTADERTKIADNLAGFNGVEQIVKTDATGNIPISLIPAIDTKLDVYNPTFTGILTGPTVKTGTVKAENDDLYLNGQGAIRLSVDAADGFIDAGALLIKNVKSPASSGDAATKAYVDAVANIGVHPVEYAAAATNVNIDVNTGISIVDDHLLVVDDRILLFGQTVASQNGVYSVDINHLLTKVTEDSTQGAYIFVANGTLYNDWYFTNTDGTTWVATGRPDTITAGTDLVKNGNVISAGDNLATVDGSNAFTGLNSFEDVTEFKEYITVDGTVNSTEGFDAINTIAGIAAKYDYDKMTYINDNGTYNYAFPEESGTLGMKETTNTTTSGTADPSITGRINGDVYFKII